MRHTSLALSLALGLGFGLALALSACGSSSSQGAGQGTTPGSATAATTSSDNPDVECHDEKPLGSSIPRKVCESKKDRDLDHQGAQDWHSAPAPVSSHPGK
jgi:hypothetical protein